MWTRAKINYPFIFEFDSRHNLDWHQLAEVSNLAGHRKTSAYGVKAPMPVPVLARALPVAQLSAVRHRRHVPLLASRTDWPYRPDSIHACSNPLSQEP